MFSHELAPTYFTKRLRAAHKIGPRRRFMFGLQGFREVSSPKLNLKRRNKGHSLLVRKMPELVSSVRYSDE